MNQHIIEIGSIKDECSDSVLTLKMGSIFPRLCIFFLALQALPCKAQSIILPPQDPVKMAVPVKPDTQNLDADLKTREKDREQKLEEAGIIQPPPDPQKIQQQELIKAATSPAPMRWALLINLSYSMVSTSGHDRKNYNSDPSVGVHSLYRVLSSSEATAWTLWLGARAQSFQGTATYRGTNGSYAFLYWGPSIAWGKIDDGPLSSGPDADGDESKAVDVLAARQAYFFATGIAAVSRSVRPERDHESGSGDFHESGLGFDQPGLWTELHYHRIKYNALSYGGLVGMQLGQKKVFVYTGLTVGGWN